MNHLAKLAANALFCLKYTCDAAQPAGLGLGLMLGADEILKQANKEPIFVAMVFVLPLTRWVPILGSMLSIFLPLTRLRVVLRKVETLLIAR